MERQGAPTVNKQAIVTHQNVTCKPFLPVEDAIFKFR